MNSNENQALTEGVYYILLALHEPLHGYGIMQRVEAFSGGRVRLAAGTLYGALGSMCEKGWIEALGMEKSSRKKEYRITAQGKETAAQELRRLRELVRNGEELLEGNYENNEA